MHGGACGRMCKGDIEITFQILSSEPETSESNACAGLPHGTVITVDGKAIAGYPKCSRTSAKCFK